MKFEKCSVLTREVVFLERRRIGQEKKEID